MKKSTRYSPEVLERGRLLFENEEVNLGVFGVVVRKDADS